MAWKLPFGGHQCVGGTENFPQLYLETNNLILQHDSWNCGFAVMLMLLEVCTVWNNREGYRPDSDPNHEVSSEEDARQSDSSGEDGMGEHLFTPVPDYALRSFFKRVPGVKKEENYIVVRRDPRVNEDMRLLGGVQYQPDVIFSRFRKEYFLFLHGLKMQYLESLSSTTPLTGSDDASESSGEVQVVVPKKKPPVIIQILDGDEPQTVGDPGETENSSGLDGGSAAVEGTPPLNTDNITLNVAGETAHSQQGVTDKLETAEEQAKKIPKQQVQDQASIAASESQGTWQEPPGDSPGTPPPGLATPEAEVVWETATVTGGEPEEDFIATDGAPLEASGAGDRPTSDGVPTLEDHSKTQVEAAQATDGLLAAQETATTAEAVLVTQETSGDLHRSQDLHPMKHKMDDTSATDPGIKASPVNKANPDEANPVSEASQVNEAVRKLRPVRRTV